MTPGDKVFLKTAPNFTWKIDHVDGEFITLVGLDGKHNKNDYMLEAPIPEVVPPNDRTEIYSLPSLNPVPSYEEIVELDKRITSLEASQHPSNKNLMIAIIGSVLLHAILLVL